MKAIIATFLIICVIGDDVYCLAAQKNSTSSITTTTTSRTTTKPTSKPTIAPVSVEHQNDLVAPGVTVSKGFKKTNCLASPFGLLCASSTIDGCVTKNSKTKCGKQCVCGPSDCACGKSGCYCQVNAACRCNQ